MTVGFKGCTRLFFSAERRELIRYQDQRVAGESSTAANLPRALLNEIKKAADGASSRRVGIDSRKCQMTPVGTRALSRLRDGRKMFSRLGPPLHLNIRSTVEQLVERQGRPAAWDQQLRVAGERQTPLRVQYFNGKFHHQHVHCKSVIVQKALR